MAYAVRASVDVSDLLARLEGLKNATRNRVLRRAVSAGTKIILKVAKSLCPKESGLLRRSLGRKVKVYRGSGVAVGIVGPRTKFREVVVRSKGKFLPTAVLSAPVRYAHLVELGTAAHGKHPGSAPKPFLRPAATQSANAVRAAMADAILDGLSKANAGGA